MTAYQCPKCVLKFSLKPELDWHCREEHPEFRHDYAGPWEHPEDKAARGRPTT